MSVCFFVSAAVDQVSLRCAHGDDEAFFLPTLCMRCLAYACLSLAGLALAEIVVTLENDNPALRYFPSYCGPANGSDCSAPWTVANLTGASSGTVTTTSGPLNSSQLSIGPQLFLSFRGTHITLRTSLLSTANATLTLTSTPAGTTLVTNFNSSVGSISAVNLPSDEDMELALTYVSPGRLDVDAIMIFADNETVTSLSSIPGPTSSALPTFVIPTSTSTSTSTPSPRSSRRLAQPVGTIIGETLAAFFGLCILGILAYLAVVRQRALRRDRQRFSPADTGFMYVARPGEGVPGHETDVELDSMGPRAI
ncbi:unnamed protein product [Peniophora sp. CBMAI 1063]|nr:unnamed protein product [Peniophora sp. CBMAI 1063]